MNANGTVKGQQKISDTAGGFAGIMEDSDSFGSGVASLGDLDGDGLGDLAVGAFLDDPPDGTGAVWILFLNADGTVKGQRLINANNGGGMAGLILGTLAFVGDMDGDGIGDLASGNTLESDGGVGRGAVWILFLNGPFQAAATVRNGAGINAGCGVNQTLPALGASWDTEVLHAQHSGATLTILYGYLAGTSGLTIPAGEILVDLSSERLFRDIVPSTGTSDLHSLFVPLDIALAGFSASTQALILGGAGPELCNAVDIQLGF